MKYKVGDKVRVRKDLEVGKWYMLGKTFFTCNEKMKKYKGKIVTISEVNDIYYHIKELKDYGWIDEMLEPVEDIIEYKGKKYDVCEITNDYNCKGNKIFYLKLEEHKEEHKEEILDEAEKRYLRNVIKYVIEPTHNEIECIRKTNILDGFFLIIKFDNGYDESLHLPYFNDKRMYKGMELDKEYTLEELGL